MELVTLLYAAAVADNIKGLLVGGHRVLFVFGLLAIVATAYSAGKVIDDVSDEAQDSLDVVNLKKLNRLARKCATVLFYSWAAVSIAASLVPTREDVYVMAGGYVALKVVNDPVVQGVGNKALSSIDRWLDKELPSKLDTARAVVEKAVPAVTEGRK